MKILMIAPQPFFEPRGTPISVLQRLHGLSALGYQVDLVTYHLGEDVDIPGVTIIRAPRLPFIRQVKIGPSYAKVLLDILLFFQTVWQLLTQRYHVIHSHEEAAYFAMPLAWLFGTAHLYDMHSSIPKQLAGFKFGNYRPIIKLWELMEAWVLHTCWVVVTIGSDLEDHVLQVNPRANHIRVENAAVQNSVAGHPETINQLRDRLNLEGKLAVVYTGTFEHYQGLDMLLASIPIVTQQNPDAVFLLVGGKPEQVAHWQHKANSLGLTEQVMFLGTVSLAESAHYLEVADALISPRLEGPSVPMKIYSYMLAGKAIVATNILAHTQVLDEVTAVLAEPNPKAFADALLRLLGDSELRQTLGRSARTFAEKEFSIESYIRKLDHAYLSIKYRQPIRDLKPPEREMPASVSIGS
jgi:glycosyltransferase involved in cell wall biosynthesis